jgi:chromosome segregation ATPase
MAWHFHPAARRLLCVAMAGALAGVAVAPASAQSDRDRRQLMQLQQQVQQLRQENAQLQQGQAQAAEKARGESEQVKRDAERLKAASAGGQREARRLGGELAQAREALARSEAEVATLKATLAQRDAALQTAANEHRRAEVERATLGSRLKLNTQRAERCETKHAQAMALGEDVLKRYEDRQLRACEPFTGLWRVGEEERIQALRDRLFDARLDVPPAEPTAAGPAPAPSAKP